MGKPSRKDAQVWSEHEFRGISLGDKRLENRIKRIAGELAAIPEAPINQACEDWAATKAAYRFFQNEGVSKEAIIKPHISRTIQRMQGEKIILAIQDTSFLNFNSHQKARDLGPIGNSDSNNQGLVMHNTLATTTTGLPLGFLTSTIWAREGYAQKTEKERRHTSMEEKESYRWIQALHNSQSLTPVGTSLVTICDRESDIYEFFVAAKEHSAKFVIRASADRCLSHKKSKYLWEHLKSRRCAGTYSITVEGNSKRKKRIAQVNVRFAEVALSSPQRIGQKLPEQKLSAIYVVEPTPQSHLEPIEWMLLTNLQIDSFDDAVEKISWYCCRWQIETFHKILKSGCAVEDCRLETAQRLCRYITLMSIVAWRIFWMTYIKRANPRAPASKILTPQELKTLAALENKKLPKADHVVPTVEQAIISIAKLGGFLARKHDRHPGPTALWRGWTVFQNASMLAEVVFSEKTCG